MRRALVVLAAALIVPAGAVAHVSIEPPFVAVGVATEIGMTVPNERPPHATVALQATMPAGISVVSASAPYGWRAIVDGATVTWSDGRIEGRATAAFPIRIIAEVRPGTYGVSASQRYDDGAVVRWTSDLIVLPTTDEAASDERPWPVIAAGVIGIFVIGASLVILRRLRR
ncbi:DUF1775 domain-containing protein [Gaiella sp.]|uniref:DUF1775 domain-containing protein n=1 Tax=Gaiella sp. TaxID=2663207 RepID=UPI003263F0E7